MPPSLNSFTRLIEANEGMEIIFRALSD